jgi:hypothetical protein
MKWVNAQAPIYEIKIQKREEEENKKRRIVEDSRRMKEFLNPPLLDDFG